MKKALGEGSASIVAAADDGGALADRTGAVSAPRLSCRAKAEAYKVEGNQRFKDVEN